MNDRPPNLWFSSKYDRQTVKAYKRHVRRRYQDGYRKVYTKRTFKEYIESLAYKWEVNIYSKDSEYSFPTKRIGGRNPYRKCAFCGISEPYVSFRGHAKDCEWNRMRKMILGLQRVWEEQNKKPT